MPTDAHRALGKEHELASALSHVEFRQVASDYTFRYAGKLYLIARKSIAPGLRGGAVRVEKRLDGSVAVCFRDVYLSVSECQIRPKATIMAKPRPQASGPSTPKAERTAAWKWSNHQLFQPGPGVMAAAAVNRTRTRDKLD